MSIKIIKEGKKEFEYTCPYCGCVFTYEIEDVDLTNQVECPCCHKHLYINSGFINTPVIGNPIPCRTGTETIPQDIKIWYDSQQISTNYCENCEWYKRMISMKEPYVGDSPCQWCINSPNKLSCK